MTNHAEHVLTIRELLALPDFRRLWIGQVISDFGDALTQLTLILFINRISDGDTGAIAYLLIAMALPHATIGLASGVFVDRLSRKQVMIWSDLLRGLLTLGYVWAAGQHNLSAIYLVTFLHSTVGTFFTPARGAMIPNIVPAYGLLTANTLAQTTSVIARVLGVATAGFVVGTFALYWPIFTLDALTFLIALFFVSRISVAGRAAVGSEAADIRAAAPTWGSAMRTVFTELRTGLRMLFASPILLGVVVGAGITMLGLGAVNVLLAPLLVNEMDFSETWFGVLELAQTTGMVLSGMVVATLAARLRPTTIISVGLGILGIAMGLLAPVTHIWQLFPLLFVVGLIMTPIGSAIATLMQTEVQDELRGRVGASMNAVTQVASLLSMFAAGTLATWVGTRTVFGLGGGLTIVAALLAGWIFGGRGRSVGRTVRR